MPYRPLWRMPDALDEVIYELDPLAQVAITRQWQKLSVTARADFWKFITSAQLRRFRLKRAFLVAELLLKPEAVLTIPSPVTPME